MEGIRARSQNSVSAAVFSTEQLAFYGNLSGAPMPADSCHSHQKAAQACEFSTAVMRKVNQLWWPSPLTARTQDNYQ